MATESPIRILEASGKWPSGREAATLGQSSVSVSSEELRLLLSVNGRNAVPNRSESAPPSIEGSVAALQDFVSQQDSSGYANLASINSAIGNYQSEEQLRTDPAYVAYYCSNANLNPRLPPPLISWETSRLAHRVGSRNNSWRLSSFSDSSNDSLHLSQRNLPTHDEESEDDKSSQMPPDDRTYGNNEFGPGQERTSSDQHQNLVNLIQDDLSPRSSPSIKDESIVEAVDLNSGSSSLCDTSVSIANAITSPADVEYIGRSSNTHPTATIERSTSVDSSAGTVAKSPVFSRKSNRIDVHLENAAITGGHTEADVVYVESQMKAVYVTRLPNPDTHKNQKYRQNNRQNNSLQQPVYQQENESHIHLSKPQLISQGVNHTYTSVNQFLRGPSSFSAGEFQPILQPSGFTTPLYAAAAAYMASPNLFYPNLPPSGYIPPHYGVGGYLLNSAAIPTFVGGYPPHSAIPLAFDGAAGPSLSSRTFGVSNGGSLAHGQFGFTMQTSLADPFHMQYSQQLTTDACNVSGHLYPVVSRTGVVANQVRIPNSKKGGVFSFDQQPPQQETVGSSNLTSRSDRTISSQYIGSSALNMGMLIQFPTSPIGNPVLRGSPVDGLGFLGGRNEVSFPPFSSRNNGVYPGWQGESKPENVSGSRVYSFLEELKSGKGRRFELSDIAGHIVEFSTDQLGSRFIQQKLESCNVEEKASVFKEVIPYAAKLMTDVFGNYVIQKFFEYGSANQRNFLANQLEGRILPLSLQMYGCRVIQKALDVIELDQKIGLVLELDGHIIRCVRDQNGNHVIQKCIESIPADKIRFIISAFRGQVATLSTHPYGCRVIQRVLERCTDELQSQFIVDEILESICALSQDQYGNYVTQHVLERGKPRERSQIIRKLSGHIVQMSQHKFASNVVEKCLQHGDSATWEVLIGEILGQHDGNDNLLAMMKDQYANYVVQKILETCTADQREMLLRRISAHLNALKKYTYGKHIVARFEQLYGEEIQKSESCCC